MGSPATTTGTAIAPRPHERFMSYLQERAKESANRGFEATAGQMDKILRAAETGDVDAIWGADMGGSVSGKEFQNIPFQINAIDVAESDDQYDASLGVFVLMRATTLEEANGYPVGTEVVVTTGAPLIVTKVVALERADAFPCNVVIRGIKAKKGDVLKLEQAPNRAVSTA